MSQTEFSPSPGSSPGNPPRIGFYQAPQDYMFPPHFPPWPVGPPSTGGPMMYPLPYINHPQWGSRPIPQKAKEAPPVDEEENKKKLKEREKKRVRFAVIWYIVVGCHLSNMFISIGMCVSAHLGRSDVIEGFLKYHPQYGADVKAIYYYVGMSSAATSFLGALISILSSDVGTWIYVRPQIKAYVTWGILQSGTYGILFYIFLDCRSKLEAVFLKDTSTFKKATIEKYTDDNLKSVLDEIQTTYECCGVLGFDDWKTISTKVHEFSYDIPESCCQSTDCKTSSTVWEDIVDNKYQEGCLKKTLLDLKWWLLIHSIASSLLFALSSTALVLSILGLRDPRDLEEIEAHEMLFKEKKDGDDVDELDDSEFKNASEAERTEVTQLLSRGQVRNATREAFNLNESRKNRRTRRWIEKRKFRRKKQTSPFKKENEFVENKNFVETKLTSKDGNQTLKEFFRNSVFFEN